MGFEIPANDADDGFFVSIELKDPLFDIEDTKKFLLSIGGENIEVVEE